MDEAAAVEGLARWCCPNCGWSSLPDTGPRHVYDPATGGLVWGEEVRTFVGQERVVMAALFATPGKYVHIERLVVALYPNGSHHLSTPPERMVWIVMAKIRAKLKRTRLTLMHSQDLGYAVSVV